MDEGVDDFMGSKRGSRSFTEAMEKFRFMEIPLSPLLHNTPANDDPLFISPRDYGSRQAFLRSYTFTRADHPEPDQHEEAAAAAAAEAEKTSEQRNKSLLRLKAAAWAVVACNVKYRLPLRARLLKDKMVIKTSQYLTHSVYCLRSPTMPRCLVAGA